MHRPVQERMITELLTTISELRKERAGTKHFLETHLGGDKLHEMNATQRETIAELQGDAESLQNNLDETRVQLDHEIKRVEMREMTIRQTVHKNKELREELTEQSAEVTRLKKEMLAAQKIIDDGVDTKIIQGAIDEAYRASHGKSTLFSNKLMEVLTEEGVMHEH